MTLTERTPGERRAWLSGQRAAIAEIRGKLDAHLAVLATVEEAHGDRPEPAPDAPGLDLPPILTRADPADIPALLSDLSRPASRDAVARLVAERLGLTCGATAPGFYRAKRGYVLEGATEDKYVFFPYFPGDEDRKVGDLYTADPTEALTLIALAVLS